MRCFIVVKQGVYRHDLWGVRYSLDAAKVLARERLGAECDDYHGATVISLCMDEESGDDNEVVVGSMLRADDKEFLGGGAGGWKIHSQEYHWFDGEADFHALVERVQDFRKRTYSAPVAPGIVGHPSS